VYVDDSLGECVRECKKANKFTASNILFLRHTQAIQASQTYACDLARVCMCVCVCEGVRVYA